MNSFVQLILDFFLYSFSSTSPRTFSQHWSPWHCTSVVQVLPHWDTVCPNKELHVGELSCHQGGSPGLSIGASPIYHLSPLKNIGVFSYTFIFTFIFNKLVPNASVFYLSISEHHLYDIVEFSCGVTTCGVRTERRLMLGVWRNVADFGRQRDASKANTEETYTTQYLNLRSNPAPLSERFWWYSITL